MGHVYIGSDWHGDYSIYAQAKKIMKKEDKLYYLGDSLDRRECSIKLFLALMEDPQVTFLMGNHEEMAYKVLVAPDYDPLDKELWFNNGGLITYNQFYNIKEPEILEKAFTYLRELYEKPTLTVVTMDNKKFFLSHAGFSFNKPMNFLWDRMHIFDKTPNNFDDYWIIHGHTPVQTLPWNLNDNECLIDNYAPRKIDIDLGTFRSHKAALLALDNLNDPIYIETDDSLNENAEEYSSVVIPS